MSRTLALINPAAGRGRAPEIWERLTARFPELASAERVPGESAEEARRELTERVAAGATRVVALGGDGTMHQSANAIVDSGRAAETELILIPAGTGSDLVRNLGLPLEPMAAAEKALAGKPRAIDGIRLTADDGRLRHIFNSATAGISGPVLESLSKKEIKGQAGYLTATLAALWSYRPLDCRVEVDGELFHEGPIMLAAMVNGVYFGRGMKVAPGAQLDDSELDVCVIGDIPRWQLPFRLPQIYLGTHLKSRYADLRRAQHVRFEPLVPFPPFELDGEAFPAAAMTLEIAPGALRVRC